MKTRLIELLVVLALLTAPGRVAADAADARGPADSLAGPDDRSGSHLDRRLALALARMDENLLALLGPATLDCAGVFVASGLETCVARLDGSRGAEGPASD